MVTSYRFKNSKLDMPFVSSNIRGALFGLVTLLQQVFQVS